MALPTSRASSGGLPSASGQSPLVFGKYRIHRRIGRGGMGEVYLVSLVGELGFEKRLVIKTILPELAAIPRFVEMFAAEAKTAVSLSHGNIVPIYELGKADDILYIVMGHVDGPSVERMLAAYRKRGRASSVGLSLFIVREVLTGLAYAHREEPGRAAVVHRDISPRNVLVDRSGQVRIVDFGIAVSTNVTSAVRGGSTGYMAPEQARAEVADPRADVFSTACLLYELITLDKAFPKKGVWAPPDMEAVPAPLRPLLERAMSIDPIRRPANAGAFLAELAPMIAQHAATLTDTTLAGHLRGLFPEGWEQEDSPAEPDQLTPVTNIEPMAYATRLTDVSSSRPRTVASTQAPSPEAANASPPTRSGLLVPAIVVSLLGAVAIAVVLRLPLQPSTSDAPAAAPLQAPYTDLPAAAGSVREPAALANPRAATKPDRPATTAPSDAAPPSRSADADAPTDPSAADAPAADAPAADAPADPSAADADADPSAADAPADPSAADADAAMQPDATPADPGVASEETPRRGEAKGRGELRVLAKSVAWAEVLVDGKHAGATPTPAIDLTAGSHRVVVRCLADVCDDERVLFDRHVTIRAGELTTVDAR